MNDANIAESSAVAEEVIETSQPEAQATPPASQSEKPEEQTPQQILDKMTGPQYQEWLKTGKMPESDKAESDTAPQAEEKKPESAPEQPQEAKPETEKRFKQLLKDRHEARQEAERLRAELAELRNRPAEPAQQIQQPSLPTAPKLEDFSTYDQFQQAEREYIREVAKIEAKQQLEAERAREKAEQQTREIAEAWNKRVEEYKKQDPDFDEAIAAASIPGINVLAPLIVRSEVGPAIANYLMLNPAVAESMASKDVLGMAKEFARLEVKLEKPTQAAEKQVKTITQAAPPPRKVTGTSSPVDPIEDAISKGDFTTYKRLMDERDARLRTR